MAATRLALRSWRARSPATPAFRRTIDTARATVAAAATPSDAASRTGTGSTTSPAAAAPRARTPYTARSNQP